MSKPALAPHDYLLLVIMAVVARSLAASIAWLSVRTGSGPPVRGFVTMRDRTRPSQMPKGHDIDDQTQLARVVDLLHDIAERTKRREASADPAERREWQAERCAIEAAVR